MLNQERGGLGQENEQSTKKILVKGTFGDEKINNMYRLFAEQTGRAKVDITSTEAEELRRECLEQQTETSPEVNNEIMFAIKDLIDVIVNKLRDGDKEEALAAIKQMKRLTEKLEQGITNIQ